MSIRMIGIDHSRAGVEVRELFSLTSKKSAAVMERICSERGVYGCVVLSTCNRMEIYVSCDEDMDIGIYDVLCDMKDTDKEKYRDVFAEREEKRAVQHLFYLACGLKSRILGEDQIITQVKDALVLARENYCTDKVLEVLFRMAVTAGKRVKTDVKLSPLNTSVIDHAVGVLKDQGFVLDGKKCMVIGNGEMGKTAALALLGQGADVTVTVRQYKSGIVQVLKGCKRIDYGERMEYIPECELVVSATASPNYTLKMVCVERAVLEKELIILDLAVPRDVEPAVGELPNVTLLGIDDFQVDGQSEEMRENVKKAEQILAGQMQEFYIWYEGRDIIPKIQKITENAAADLEGRIHKTIKSAAAGDDEAAVLKKDIEAAAGKVFAKMIYGLRGKVGQDTFLECIEGLEEIYEE